MENPTTNLKVVREFLNKDSNNPPTTTEMMLFWKALTEEEKNQFGEESRKLLAA